MILQVITSGLAPLKGEGALAPLRDPMMPLGNLLGSSSPARVSLGGTPLGALGGGSPGKGSLGGASLLGGSLSGGSLSGSFAGGPLGSVASGGRFANVEQHRDPFQQARFSGIKTPLGVSFK